MVLKIKSFTLYSLIIVFFFLGISCNQKIEPIFLPTQDLSSEDASNLPITPVNLDLLGDLVTKLLQEESSVNLSSSLKPIEIKAVASHPNNGPFFFTSKSLTVIVVKGNGNVSNWLDNLNPALLAKDIVRVSLLEAEGDFKITLSKEVSKMSSVNKAKKYSPTSVEIQDGQYMLSPDKLAEALSNFDQWEGVHLDEVNEELFFYGSDKTKNPQISASDLIAAYNAIFVHEAAGEALFVDMDFAGNKEDYLVTFGGGFEDTRPGKVLLAADLMLKALSSGIDPWSNEKPLVKQMCAVSKKTPFQKLFCEYVNPSTLSNANLLAEIKEAEKKFELGIEAADIIKTFARQADINQKSQGPWNHVFFASKYDITLIKNEVKAMGYFSYGDDGCACIPKYDEITNCEKDCNGEATLLLVERIANLTYDQKMIVEEARKFSDENSRILFATFAYSSDKIRSFLVKEEVDKVENLFRVFEELLSYGYEKNSLNVGISIFTFLSEYPEFTENFLKLSKDNQFILSFILTRMILNPEFTQFINQLQFHNPLCCDSCEIPSAVNSSDDAFIRFVCKHLKQFPRTYLADLIREEEIIDFDYNTAAEYRSSGLANPLGPGSHTTRYWFFPENEVLYLSKNLNTFLFNRPAMEAKAERINDRKGPFESINYQDEKIPGVHENLELINDNYETLAEVFPTLKELNNLVKMLSFFRWIRDFHPYKFNMEAFVDAVDFGTPTERIYPIYETVIALPKGGLLRSIGGVDLHSNTQVSFNQGKIDSLLMAASFEDGHSDFSFGGHQFTMAEPIKKEISQDSWTTISYESKDNSIIEITEKNDALSDINFIQNGQLVKNIENGFDIFGNKRQSQTYFQNANYFKENKGANGKVLEQWITKSSDYALSLEKVTNIVEDLAINQRKRIEQELTDLARLDLPLEAIWKIMTPNFEDARVIKTNGNIIFSYRNASMDYHYKFTLANDGKTEPLISQITDFDIQELIQKKKSKESIIGTQLKSSLPTDSLWVDELGITNDSLLQVNLVGEVTKNMDIFQWRRILTEEETFPFDLQQVNIISPTIYEFRKGAFPSFELTNRPFLVDVVSNLRHKALKPIALSRDTDPKYDTNSYAELWDVPQKRFFIIDPKGFSKSYLNNWTQLAKQYPEQIQFLTDEFLSEQQEVLPTELIWITTLSEQTIQNRLELMDSQQFFRQVKRLRVLNINNSVFDLGINIFNNNPNLKIVGAYPHILDFETVFPVLNQVLSDRHSREFDEQIRKVIQKMQKEYKKMPTPIRLRIGRHLDSFNISWEEITPKNLNWKKYN